MAASTQTIAPRLPRTVRDPSAVYTVCPRSSRCRVLARFAVDVSFGDESSLASDSTVEIRDPRLNLYGARLAIAESGSCACARTHARTHAAAAVTGAFPREAREYRQYHSRSRYSWLRHVQLCVPRCVPRLRVVDAVTRVTRRGAARLVFHERHERTAHGSWFVVATLLVARVSRGFSYLCISSSALAYRSPERSMTHTHAHAHIEITINY